MGNSSPASAAAWAVDKLKHHNLAIRQVLDIGCGQGDTSLWLAQNGATTTCIDFTTDAIRSVESRASEAGLSHKVRPLCLDATEDWPVAEHSFDLFIDLHCFRHIHDHSLRENYKHNLLRSLRVHGRYLIGVGIPGDGYYGRYDRDSIGILHTRHQLVKFFSPELSLDAEWSLPVEEITPSPFALLFQRNPHVIG